MANQSRRMINTSAAQLQISPTLEINEAVMSRRKAGKMAVQLSFGEATLPIQVDMLVMHKHGSSFSSYPPVAGIPELRKARVRHQA